jgi:Flp pilus assembly protein TadG
MSAQDLSISNSSPRALKRRFNWRSLLTGNRGSAILELGLLMPMFTLLLAGSADFARFAYGSIEVSNAAHAGIQYGMQNRNTALDLTGMAQAAVNDGPDVTGLKATATDFCVCTDGTSITCANAGTKCLSPARVLQYVQVNTSAQLNTTFNYPGLPTTLTLLGQATARVEQ